MAWMREPDGSFLFVPVEVAGDRLATRTRLVVDPVLGTVYFAAVCKRGDTHAIGLRPADARRLGTALIEASALASQELRP